MLQNHITLKITCQEIMQKANIKVIKCFLFAYHYHNNDELYSLNYYIMMYHNNEISNINRYKLLFIIITALYRIKILFRTCQKVKERTNNHTITYIGCET